MNEQGICVGDLVLVEEKMPVGVHPNEKSTDLFGIIISQRLMHPSAGDKRIGIKASYVLYRVRWFGYDTEYDYGEYQVQVWKERFAAAKEKAGL